MRLFDLSVNKYVSVAYMFLLTYMLTMLGWEEGGETWSWRRMFVCVGG